MNIKSEWVINRQGKDMILYKGLLALAHEHGVQSIHTSIYQPPLDVNNKIAIVHATVTLKDGRSFDGVGDADATNVNRNIAPHIIRMAETRAKARALRDALNIDMIAAEEVDADDEPTPPRRVQVHSQAEAVQTGEAIIRQMPTNPRPAATPPAPARPAPVADADAATTAQVRAVYAIGRNQRGMSEPQVDDQCQAKYGCLPNQLMKRQASEYIQFLQAGQSAAG